ncbi:hypothetical protein Tco_1322860 [Tanacetum coccineum]
MGLWYPKDAGFELTAFSDSDHASCLDTRKSTSGGIQFLGGDKLVSWSSKKQDCTSMSSAKAKYVSLSACCVKVQWLRTQLTDYGFYCDNRGSSRLRDRLNGIGFVLNFVKFISFTFGDKEMILVIEAVSR